MATKNNYIDDRIEKAAIWVRPGLRLMAIHEALETFNRSASDLIDADFLPHNRTGLGGANADFLPEPEDAPRILPAEHKPLPKAREPELVEFLKAMKPTNADADLMAAEKHFHARITRERFRTARALAGTKGVPGRPRKDH